MALLLKEEVPFQTNLHLRYDFFLYSSEICECRNGPIIPSIISLSNDKENIDILTIDKSENVFFLYKLSKIRVPHLNPIPVK